MKKLWFCLVFVMLLGILTSAQAITIIESSQEVASIVVVEGEPIKIGKALILETPNMSSEKPTLLFFGGKGERSSAIKTARLLEGVSVFNDWNVCSIAVNRDQGNIYEWKDVAESLREYISQRVKDGKIDPENIWVDAYSNGAAGGFYSTIELHNMPVVVPDGMLTEVQIKELTLIEGTLRGIIKSAQVEQLLSMGVPVTMYVSEFSSYNLSQHGRDLVKEFRNREDFTGILVDHGHGNGIVALVSEVYGNHEADGLL